MENKNIIFLIIGIAILIIQINFVLGATTSQHFQGGTNWGFSGVQYTRPGSYQTFSQNYASVYWPILGDREKCEAQTDFLIFIRPGGCSPNVVRSDLLEEQNVPVFCKIDVVKINPLVDIKQLKSVKFTGDFGKYVAGINFHPNAEAISSGYDSLENPLINDAGYVVVVLKRIQAEKDMPDSIKVNLTGVLRYDAKNFFGAGQQNYYLEVVDNEKWDLGNNYKENSFFQGRGYLKLDAVQDERAYVSIYKDKDTKLTSFVLEKGKTSSVYYMPGFYCKAGISLRLDDLIGKVKKVVLEVDDNKLSLVEGERFLDNLCRVNNIDVSEPDKTTKQVEKSVSISCKGQNKVLKYTENAERSETLNQDSTKKILENMPLEELQQKVFNQAKEYAEDINAFYGSVADDAGNIYSAKALYQLGLLADKLNQTAISQEIFSRIISDYPNTAYAISAELKLSSIGAPSASYKEHNIRLLEIEVPDKSTASADFVIDGVKVPGIQEKEFFGKTKGDTSFRLIKLYEDKVDLEYNIQSGTQTEKGTFTLGYGSSEKRGDYVLSVTNISYVQIAKVSIVSQMSNSYSQSDFLFEIGIEKRAIQLSPAKTQSLIDNLNSQIKSLEGTVNKLGNVVKGMKTACFATSAMLIAKNLFTNLGGGATARQEAMPGWYAQCEKEAGSKTADINACLNKHNTEIENDVKARTKILESTNKKITDIQKATLTKESDVVNRKKSAEELLKELPGKGMSDLTYTSSRINKETGVLETSNEKIPLNKLQSASLTDLRDILYNYQILTSTETSNNVAKPEASAKIDKIALRLSQKTEDKDLYPCIDAGNINIDRCVTNSWVNSVSPNFYLSGSAKNFVHLAPIPKEYSQNVEGGGTKRVSGFYVIVDEGDYEASGNFKGFWIQNIGSDDVKDISGDPRIYVNYANIYSSIRGQVNFWNLTGNHFDNLLEDAVQAIKQSNKASGQKKYNLLGTNVVVDLSGSKEGARCQDFMSPSDCFLLFNVCDPVICPSSRCDLGGRYPVDNVIQSGIIGSIALCLPNIKEPIYMPVCLSGIHAGLDAYLGILKSYKDCLKENLETGKTIGICDEIHSIYLCEFFWRQAAPFLDNLLISMMEKAQGQGMKGGGEYLTVADAWTNAEKSVNYIQSDYAVNSYNAFKVRSTSDIGTEFCKLFVSAKTPNKGIFDNLVEPDSPVQFHAWYDEIPYSDATAPATSQYKVFYYIWAGKDIGSNYQVYLKTPAYNAYRPAQEIVMVNTGYVNKGSYVSQTRDFTAPSGYQELCVRINGKDECGFKKVSTSFAVDYASDQYYKEQLTNPVRTKDECISGSSSAYSLLNPNVQEGVAGAINPSIDTQGVIRICSTANPGKQTEQTRWKDVGYCDDESLRCWLDTNSVEKVIQDRNLSAEIIQSGNSATGIVDASSVLGETQVADVFKKIEVAITQINDAIKTGTTPDAKKLIIEKFYRDSISLETSTPSILKLINDLKGIEDKANLNKYAAEAAYYKFEIFNVLGSGLAVESGVSEGAAVASATPVVTTTASIYKLENGKITLDGADTGLTIVGDKINYREPLSLESSSETKTVGSVQNNKLSFTKNNIAQFSDLHGVLIIDLEKSEGYIPQTQS